MVNIVEGRRSETSKDDDHTKVSSASVDRISLLPDEILGFILSFLTLKEATATSILSRRWEYLWILTPKLDFDGTDSLQKVKMARLKEKKSRGLWEFSWPFTESTLEKERRKYVRWVDRVITVDRSLHKKRSLEEFRVLFDLSSSHADWMDDWLSYAFSRKVQRLELNLMNSKADTNASCYDFPYEKGNFPNNPNYFRMLRSVSMHNVDVTGEAVEFFLGNCPLLEKVSVSRSEKLEYLDIIRTFPSFKCLDISLCNKLKSVEVRDSNVVTINYSGETIKFLLINVTLLTELWIRGPLLCSEVFIACFRLCFRNELSWTDSRKFVSDVEMHNLKEMVVSLEKGYNDRVSVSSLIYLIRASPCLQRFVLEAPLVHGKDDYLLDTCFAVKEIPKSIPRAYFDHLKEVEFLGYRGAINQYEAMMHLTLLYKV